VPTPIFGATRPPAEWAVPALGAATNAHIRARGTVKVHLLFKYARLYG